MRLPDGAKGQTGGRAAAWTPGTLLSSRQGGPGGAAWGAAQPGCWWPSVNTAGCWGKAEATGVQQHSGLSPCRVGGQGECGTLNEGCTQLLLALALWNQSCSARRDLGELS